MEGEARATIGKVLSSHGVTGRVKIAPLTDYPERYYDMESLTLYRGKDAIGTYLIEQMQPTPNGYFIVTLSGISDMDTADSLRGCTVEIPKSKRTELPSGVFWISDLIGLYAESDDGRSLGKVKDIVNSGSTQLIVITDTKGKDHLIPASKEFLLNADIKAGKMTLHLIDGLWEL